ncbi:NYN domain-containing protein [Longimicrobium sp.]|uniref:NYN domain-containing protein n=1 Tax=Longimicrobium sp. TaxID=2029185 RepID=UPI002E2FA086|nr:NYN domain-containing protein [Longimicrobium sp.]HEX6040579.1 NYN domain-containing protein [Longimicrobium sp.]
MSEQKKIALFVDFDNIYLGLRETSREAAEAFATRPHVWLRWIEHGMPMEPRPEHAGPKENRVLIRQCYLNPDTFGKYRGYFTRSGFTVVDCPSLTSRGKNSSDIVMVMDILDALRHETHFDRFVIMSADADFTPVLQRLRAHDRRTAVLVSGQAAPAYRAACDRLINEDAFIELALEIQPAPEPQRMLAPVPSPASSASPAAPVTPAVAAIRDPELLAAMGRRIYEEASSSGTLSASELPRILREFKEFTPTSNWLGYYSLQSLTEAILAHRNDLRITDDDPWRIAVVQADERLAANGGAPAARTAEPGPDNDALRDRVVELVARMVADSPEPVVMGKAAHAAIQEAGPMITETRWLGHGTFKNLLLSAPELPFKVVAFPLPGFLYDPARHASPAERAAAADGLSELDGEMASLIRRIHQLTDAPKLTPRQYGVLFRVMAKELGRAPYNLMSTGKAVRDQCVERGEPIARQSITLVLRGLGYAGYRFWDPPHRAENLANTYRGNLLNLLRQAQVTLNDDELRMLDEWLVSTPQEPSADAPAPTSVDAKAKVRAAPVDADADRAPEPDYAAWADALLASAHPRAAEPAPQPAADAAPADAPGPDPFVWPPPDALRFEQEHPWRPRDGEPPVRPESIFGDLANASGPAESADWVDSTEPAEVTDSADSAEPVEATDSVDSVTPAAAADSAEAIEPTHPASSVYDAFAWPPSDALEGHPADAPASSDAADQPSSDAPAPPATDEPTRVETMTLDEQPVGAAPPAVNADSDAPQPITSADDADASHPVVIKADAVDAETQAAAPTDADDADAIPVELSDDHGPRGPDVVTAEWEMSADPADVAAPVDLSVPEHASSADPAPADDAQDASSDAQPDASADPPSTDASEHEVVPAAWEPAEPVVVNQPSTDQADADQPSANQPAADEPGPVAADTSADADQPQPDGRSAAPADGAARDEPADIFTPYWEPADGPASAPEAPPADPPSSAGEAPREPQPTSDVVTPQWEPVGEAPHDAAPGAPAQMDAFPAEPRPANEDAPRGAHVEPVSAAPDAAPEQDDAPPPAPRP